MHLNELLHTIVARVAHRTEQELADLHAAVDVAAPAPEPEPEPDADAPAQSSTPADKTPPQNAS